MRAEIGSISYGIYGMEHVEIGIFSGIDFH